MKEFKEYLQERTSTSVLYRIKHSMGNNASIIYRHDGGDNWHVSKDGGKTWKKATNDHPSPLYNVQDIEAEMEAGSLEKVVS